MPKARLILEYPISYKAHVANTKIPNSSINLKKPGITTGAFPERLGSFGTAKVPHDAARIIGIHNASTKLSHPSLCFHPQIPVDVRADNSSKNRTARLIGFEPIGKDLFCKHLSV